MLFKLDYEAFPPKDIQLILRIELLFCDRLTYNPDYEIAAISKVEFKMNFSKFTAQHLPVIFEDQHLSLVNAYVFGSVNNFRLKNYSGEKDD